MTTSPMRIDIHIADFQAPSSPNEDQIKELRTRLSTTPTKDPEEIAKLLASKTARTAMLRELEIEAKLTRAKRVNDLLKENRARKLRMESAAVARASSKIENATKVESTRRQEQQAKREAAAARRAALFEAVRAARESQRIAKDARGAELAKLEKNATSIREKKIQSAVSRSSAEVKHALEVAKGLKVKETEATAAAATRLAEKLCAATSRRQDVLAATVEGAASVVQAAEKVRLRHLYNEKANIEERRVRLAKAMDKALGRREAKLESITSRAAVENARIADVVADANLSADTVKPATMRHALTQRLQAAEVRRLETLKKKPLGSRGDASPNVSLTSSPNASQAASQAASQCASPAKTAPPSPWTVAAMPKRLFKPEPVIVIDTEPFHFAALPPSSRLLSRLLFHPRMLLTTAAARQAAAAARREIRLHLTRARASHLGTVRVACVKGRRAAVAEFTRAIFELRENKGAMRAAAHLRAKAKVAAGLNERVNAAKLRRSALRLRTINSAITKEEKRLVAGSKRTAKLTILTENRVDKARAFAVEVRRAAAMERLVLRSAGLHQRCISTDSRRDAALTAIASRARRASTRREVLKPAKATDEALAEALTTAAIATALAGAHEPKPEPKPEPKEVVSEATLSAAKLPVPASSLPEAEVDARIAELQMLLVMQLQAAVASATKAEDKGLVKQRAGSVHKAAEVSAAGAARAAARAEAKLKAKEETMAVKAAVEKAAAMSGLHGRQAKVAAATGGGVQLVTTSSSTTVSFISLSVASSEEWHDASEKM